MRFITFAVLACASILSAQSLTVGLKGGGLFTDPAEQADGSDRYIVGPSFEIGFGSRFAVDAKCAVQPLRSAWLDRRHAGTLS